jgi:ribosomal-protein-alanine N-acetyltransferase
MLTTIGNGRSLRTERLRLEELAPPHAAALLAYRLRNRAHLERWEPAVDADAYTPAYQTRDIAASVMTARADKSVRFLVFEADGSDVVASINLWSVRRDVSQSATLGYSVDAACEGRGYTTEAARAVVAFAFAAMGLHRVEATYQPVNDRSGRVLRKLGFVVEGYARDYLYLNGTWTDAILTSITNDAWRPQRERA